MISMKGHRHARSTWGQRAWEGVTAAQMRPIDGWGDAVTGRRGKGTPAV